MSPIERFVDTGYWIALLNTRDALHRRALAINARLQGRIVTTEAVLVEVGNALAGLPLRALAVRFLASVRANPNLVIVPVTSALLVRAIDLYAARPDKEWGLTDCISFAVMQDRGITEALAADLHFVQAGFRALLRE